jgi:hypothetical protein
MTQPTTDRQIRLENAELLRGLVTSVEMVQTHMNAMQGQVTDIRDRVIGIEARDHGTAINNLAIKVAALEAELNQRKGATGLAASIMKSPTLGWIAGALTVFWAVVTGKVTL